MLIENLLVEESLLSMEATNKEEAIRELVGVLVRKKLLDEKNKEPVVESILKREAIGSTGIGNSVAVPHVKQCPFVKKLTGVFGRAPDGVDFSAVDGEPVHIFFLLVSPADKIDAHLGALKEIAMLARDENFCRFLKEGKSLREVMETLEERIKG